MPEESITDWEAREFKDFSKAKYGTYQNVENCPNPNIVKRVDERGDPTVSPILPQKQLISMFWQSKSKTSAILILAGAGMLFMIVANESNIFNIIFESVFNFIIWIFSLFLG